MRLRTTLWMLLMTALMASPALAQDEGDSGETAEGEETEGDSAEEPKENPKDAVREERAAAEAAAEEAAEEATDAAEEAAEDATEAATEAVEEAADAAPADAAEAVEAAADAAAEAPAEEEKKGPTVTLRAEAGFLGLFGNVESLSGNGLLHFGLNGGRHGFKLNVGGVGGQVRTPILDADGNDTGTKEWVEHARRVFADARYDLKIVPGVNSVYLLGGAFHDFYAGYELRARGDLGYAHQLFSNDRHKLRAEAGFNYTYEWYVDDEDDATPSAAHFIGARLFADYALNFNDTFGFTLTEEFLIGGTDNVDSDDPTTPDGRSITVVGLTANINKIFSVKAGYQLAVDIIPAPTFKPVDHTVTFNLVASIL